MSSIRVVVKIPAGSYPELYADLVAAPTRERAERLRLLSMLGLMELQHLKSLEKTTLSSANQPTLPKDSGRQPEKFPVTTIIRRLVSNL